MPFERSRAHGAAVGGMAVVALAGLSVVGLVVAQGRLERYDFGRPVRATSVSPVTVPPSTGPAPSTTASTTPTTPTTTVVPGPPTGLLADLFASMNADRAANGLAPLTWDDRLRASAQHTSDTMAASGLVAQQDVDALLALGFARAGQTVLAAPHDVTAASAEHGWMGSTPQRTTILDRALTSVGIGATSGPDGRVWIAADYGGAG